MFGALIARACEDGSLVGNLESRVENNPGLGFVRITFSGIPASEKLSRADGGWRALSALVLARELTRSLAERVTGENTTCIRSVRYWLRLHAERYVDLR